MSDFFVSIEFTDLQYILPPGEQIIYSTFCQCNTSKTTYNKTKFLKWNTHVLFSNNYVAYNQPDSFKKNPKYQQKYDRLEEVQGMISMGGARFTLSRGLMGFKLLRDKNLETKEQFTERSREFILKFSLFIIEKKEHWLEENRDNPEIKKKLIKGMESSIISLKLAYNKTLAKKEKKQAKKKK